MARMLQVRDKIIAEQEAEQEWNLRRKAYHAARVKADVEEKLAFRRTTYEERDLLYRVYPNKEHINSYWITEKTDEMIANRLKYRLIKTDDPKDPEVVLHLFKRSKRRRTEIDQGPAGDLYTVELYLPSGGSLEIHIIAESAESQRDTRSRLFYSVVDIGSCEHAYTVPCEAWQNYLLFRENREGIREEMDVRLLFIAIGNRAHIGGCSLENFKYITLHQTKVIRDEMMAGELYVRPTIYEAQLSVGDTAPAELLRGPTRRSLAPRFDFLAVRKRTIQKPRKQPQIHIDLLQEHEVSSSANTSRASSKSSITISSSSMPRSRSARGKRDPVWNQTEEVRELPFGVQQLIRECAQNVESRDLSRRAKAMADSLGGVFSRLSPRSCSSSQGFSENGGQRAELDDTDERASNPSEAEAMGPLRLYVDDVSAPGQFPQDVTMKTQELSSSMMSGLEDLVLSTDGASILQDENDNLDDSKASLPPLEESAASPPHNEPQDSPDVQTIDDESENEINISYIFNDSLDWYLSKVVNESQIVTVSSEDSVNSSGQEAIEDQDPTLDDDSDLFHDDQYNESYVVMGFNLRKK